MEMKSKPFTRAEKLAIAKYAYAEIKSIIDKWENNLKFSIGKVKAHWDECITVDDEHFDHSELNGYECEWGGSVRFANMKMVDAEGTEIIIPKCEKCKCAKAEVISTKSFCWRCPICGE